MKRLLLLFWLFTIVFFSTAQTTKEIRNLESQRALLEKKISSSQSLLLSTRKDVKSQLNNLLILNGQIQEREKYISFLNENIQSLSNDIESLKSQLDILEKNLIDKKKKYEASVKYMYKNKSIYEKLMFIFSAKSFSQMYRRMRYVKEYADFQRVRGKEIELRSKQIIAKKNELEKTKMTKSLFLKKIESEKERLESQHKDKKNIVDVLNKKQRSIQSEINKNKQSAQKLNAQIDKLIAIEIEKARKRALEEARKKAEEEKRKLAKSTKSSKKSTSRKTEASKGNIAAKPLEKFNLNREDRILTGNFVSNKGKLPVPVTGPYVIVGHFGMYNVNGLRNVSLDNKGIDIKAHSGANARSVFNGEVSSIFSYNGLVNILIRHGEYISVYCNLSSASVTKGSKVSTGQSIGLIHSDSSGNTILHFQLRKETSKLNPEQWIRR